jgi:anti-sigma-K factor RskA
VPAADGSAQLIAQDSVLAVSPDAIQITLEPSGGSQAPTGQVILAWE